MKNACIIRCPFGEKSQNIKQLSTATGWSEERSTEIIDSFFDNWKAHAMIIVTDTEVKAIENFGFTVQSNFDCNCDNDVFYHIDAIAKHLIDIRDYNGIAWVLKLIDVINKHS
jgi:hypothetical protein